MIEIVQLADFGVGKHALQFAIKREAWKKYIVFTFGETNLLLSSKTDFKLILFK